MDARGLNIGDEPALRVWDAVAAYSACSAAKVLQRGCMGSLCLVTLLCMSRYRTGAVYSHSRPCKGEIYPSITGDLRHGRSHTYHGRRVAEIDPFSATLRPATFWPKRWPIHAFIHSVQTAGGLGYFPVDTLHSTPEYSTI